MRCVNRITLLGNVSRQPEIRALTNGQTVGSFSLATNRNWKDSAGQEHSQAEFHTIVCWGKLAEFVGKTVKKGDPLYVDGYLKTRSWTHPTYSDVTLYKTEIHVQDVILLAPKPAETTEENDPMTVDPF